MKIVLVPDSFKGTMDSSEICGIMSAAIHAVFPAADVVSVPTADGGEGTVAAFLAARGGRRVDVTVNGPFFTPTPAFYGAYDGGAVVEMAAAAGLPLTENRLNPLATTTYGVGELFLYAAGAGAKEITVGLGGSCTNDGGCGAAAACGVRFYDAAGRGFVPVGGTLKDIARIDMSGFADILKGVAFTVLCDIDNPLYGENGAAYVFAPQKGAGADDVAALDNGLRRLDAVWTETFGKPYGLLPGGGVAGGMGAGMAAMFGAALKPGVDAILEAANFASAAQGADLIITGEGRIDSQSLRGKVPIGVARAARGSGVPVIAVVGDIDGDCEAAYDEGLRGIFTTNRRAVPYMAARETARADLAFTVRNILRFYCGLRERRR